MKLFEICSADQDVRFSPFVWRVIMCLHHKGLPFERVAMTFLETKKLLQTDTQTVPVLEDGGRQIGDSFKIAKYLEETYPHKPLFDTSKLLDEYQELNLWTDRTIALGIFRMLVKDIHDLQDTKNAAYFRKTREARIGKTLEEMHAGREALLEEFRDSLTPLRERLVQANFLSGDAPEWFDYCVFGTFQWARICSDFELLADDDSVAIWRGRMLDLFDGYAQGAKLAY